MESVIRIQEKRKIGARAPNEVLGGDKSKNIGPYKGNNFVVSAEFRQHVILFCPKSLLLPFTLPFENGPFMDES